MSSLPFNLIKICTNIRLAWFSLLLLLMVVLYGAYSLQMSPTKLALVGFRDFQISRFAKMNDSGWITLERLALSELERSDEYDVILLFGRGLSLNDQQLEYLKQATESGTDMYVASQMNKSLSISSLSEAIANKLGQYLQFGGDTNYRNALRFIRHVVDEKSYGLPAPEDPFPRDRDVLFYLNDSQVFSKLEDYQTFYQGVPSYTKQGKKVALLTSVPGPFNAYRDHVDSLIREIESRGMRVYPIASSARRLEILKKLKPDIVVFLPHGRLHRGSGRETVAWFKQQNIPMFSPLSVFENHDKWLEDAQGFSGGMLTMNVVLPELDGGIVPTVINAQFADKDGFQVFKAINGRMQRFVNQVESWLVLKGQEKKNKKIAIVYFRGPGKNALVAGNMEVAPSLYNTLKNIKQQGYDVSGLPSSFESFSKLLASQGQVMAPYAPGMEQEFLRQGNPALIDSEDYKRWCSEVLPQGRCQAISALYGEAPGNFMVTDHNGKQQIGVARLQFGNIAILPQPLPGLGSDSFKLVHGTDKAPPHSYAVVYLWIREAFKADAIMHFGTHGSLEFTPSKQVALSDNDWSDALLGGLPHFYLYTVSNVGEAIIAKRRSYASIISHLTPPFKESGLYSELKKLNDAVQTYATAQGGVRDELRKTIITLALELGLDKDLNMSVEATDLSHWDNTIYPKLNKWLETIAQASITQGLYTIANSYDKAQAESTAGLMVIDNIDATYQRLQDFLGESQLKLPILSRDDIKKWIYRSLQGESAVDILSSVLPGEITKKLVEEVNPTGQAKKQKQEQDVTLKEVAHLKTTLSMLPIYRRHLLNGSQSELDSMINALTGGYIEPSSGGDPIVNPRSLPTGRNMYSIDAERTPSTAAWEVGKSMANTLIERHKNETGQYPKKVSFTLWPSEFIHTHGASVAQVLYLLGVEPVRDPFDRVSNLRLIPIEKLGRPRIDVVIQSAGQLRDLAASRLALIEKAVTMAASAPDQAILESDSAYPNYVAQGVKAAELYLLEKGLAPAKARELSTRRSFGGLNGAYGTGIMEMVENSGDWQSDAEIADQYIHNMGANYGEKWGEYEPHLFAAALLNTEVVVQPRSSNTWGALSLDHVYEFMGGLNLAVRSVTGKDPAAYFTDYRNPHKTQLQSHNEAVWEEARTTLLNPSFIREMTEGGASSAETFAETLRNTFGWNVMKPEGIDDSLWDKIHEVYIRDKHKLDLKAFFERENPYALQEFTGVMLEAARKQLWQANNEQLAELAELHAQLVAKHEAGCGTFTCGNIALQGYIAELLIENNINTEISASYQQQLNKAQQLSSSSKSVVLKKQTSAPTSSPVEVDQSTTADSDDNKDSSETSPEQQQKDPVDSELETNLGLMFYVLLFLFILIAGYFYYARP